MTANQWISLALLIGRVATLYFIVKVVPKQHKLLKATNDPELRPLRKTLFLCGLVLAAGNVVPIVIDVAGLFEMGSFGLLLAYVFSNNFTALLAAYMMWTVYKISDTTRVKE